MNETNQAKLYFKTYDSIIYICYEKRYLSISAIATVSISFYIFVNIRY